MTHNLSIKDRHLDEFIQKVRDLAKKYPTAKYLKYGDRCRYGEGLVKDGPSTCGCIMGQAARLLNDSNPIKQIVQSAANKSVDHAIDVVLRGLEHIIKGTNKLDVTKLNWLIAVQYWQDRSTESWGMAVKSADQDLNHLERSYV